MPTTADRSAGALLAALSLLMPAFGQESAPASQAAASTSTHKLKPRSGRVAVHDVATIDLPPGYYFLDSADAHVVVEEIWSLPRDQSLVGMVLPPDFDVRRIEGWAIVVAWTEDGHVVDQDERTIDFTKVLADMRAASIEQRADRQNAGFEGFEIRAFAQAPQYDPAARKLSWATRVRYDNAPIVDDKPADTLIWEARALGRRGSLALRVVTEIEHQAGVVAAGKQVLDAVDFLPGHRYAEFDAKTDKAAPHGLAGVVAGPFVPRGGLLSLLFKPWVVVAAVAVVLFVLRAARRRSAPPRGAREAPAR